MKMAFCIFPQLPYPAICDSGNSKMDTDCVNDETEKKKILLTVRKTCDGKPNCQVGHTSGTIGAGLFQLKHLT